MPREPKVTLTLSESDARWILFLCDPQQNVPDAATYHKANVLRIAAEIRHALAECECDKGVTR